MDKRDALSIVFGAVSLVLTFISYYFYIKSEIYKRTEETVNNVEIGGTVGKEKLTAATEQLYGSVPVVLKPFITRGHIESAVQYAFDKIEAYANKQK